MRMLLALFLLAVGAVILVGGIRNTYPGANNPQKATGASCLVPFPGSSSQGPTIPKGVS